MLLESLVEFFAVQVDAAQDSPGFCLHLGAALGIHLCQAAQDLLRNVAGLIVALVFQACWKSDKKY